jgi:hypothetical protein
MEFQLANENATNSVTIPVIQQHGRQPHQPPFAQT